MLKNFYAPIDVIKTSAGGNVQLVYDKVGKQICVIKQRSSNMIPLYQKLKLINNRYVPEIFRLIKLDGKFFIVEEYVSGRTLAEILMYGDFFHEDLVAQILRQVCECLKEIHAQKIIHRDIKPSNIMLTRDNVVRLIDFSISRLAKENTSTDTEFLGTRGYAPPEQYGFGQTDSRSDIYSLGMTIQRLLGKNYSGWLSEIVARCTKLDPEDRYQSAEDLLDDLDRRRWRQRLALMKNATAVAEEEPELDIYGKFDEMLKCIQDLDVVIDGYFEADKGTFQERILGQSAEKIAEDFAKVVDSLTEDDLKTLTPEEIAEIQVELDKFHEDNPPTEK